MLEQMMKMLEGQQINSYRLNKFLGAGGFGGVFHASERGDPRPPYQGGIKGRAVSFSHQNIKSKSDHCQVK